MPQHSLECSDFSGYLPTSEEQPLRTRFTSPDNWGILVKWREMTCWVNASNK